MSSPFGLGDAAGDGDHHAARRPPLLLHPEPAKRGKHLFRRRSRIWQVLMITISAPPGCLQRRVAERCRDIRHARPL